LKHNDAGIFLTGCGRFTWPGPDDIVVGIAQQSGRIDIVTAQLAMRRIGMVRVWWLIVASLVLGACSIPAAQVSVMSPQLAAQAECVRGYGVWREVLNFCEYRSGC